MLTTLSRPALEDACAALREADRLIARAVSILMSVGSDASAGLPQEMSLMLDAGRTRTDARMLLRTAETLRAMPCTRAAFAAGTLSWSQVRALVLALKPLDVAARAELDEQIARAAGTATNPDHVLAFVDEQVARKREDLIARREQRAIDRNFMAIQGHLDGSGSFLGKRTPSRWRHS